MTLTQQWQYPKITKNSFFILFPVGGIVSCREIAPSLLYVRKELVDSLAGRALVNTDE